MKRYPMGPVEKAKKEMQKQMEEERAQMEEERAKMETELENERAKMETERKKYSRRIETLIQKITEKFGEEGICMLKESGLMDSELSSVPSFSTGTGSGS